MKHEPVKTRRRVTLANWLWLAALCVLTVIACRYADLPLNL
jgi:hypothetical protein